MTDPASFFFDVRVNSVHGVVTDDLLTLCSHLADLLKVSGCQSISWDSRSWRLSYESLSAMHAWAAERFSDIRTISN